MVKSGHGSLIINQGIHGIASFEFDSAIVRLAKTDFDTEDRYKVAYQIDDGTFWCLVDEIEAIWVQMFFGESEYDDGYSNSTNPKIINWNFSRKHLLFLNDDPVIDFVDPIYGAGDFELLTIQDSTPRSITWGTNVKWENSTPPTLSSGAGEKDLFYFSWRRPYYYGSVKKNFG